jgi:hypothetical protein
MIAALLSTSPENRSTAAEAVESILPSAMESGSEKEAAAAYEVAFRFRSNRYYRSKSLPASDGLEFWSDLGRRMLAGCQPFLARIAARDLQVASLGFESGELSLVQIAEWHGVAGLFRAPGSNLFQFWSAPIAVHLLMQLGYSEGVVGPALRARLAELGRVLASAEPPWVRLRERATGFPELRHFADDLGRPHWPDVELAPEATFGLFGVIAVIAEELDDHGRLELVSWVRRLCLPLKSEPEAALMIRFNLGKCSQPPSIGAPYDDLILKWASSKISFLNLSPPAPKAEAPEENADQAPLPLLGEGTPF